MEAPVFEEFDPESDCDCPGCAARRRASHLFSPAPSGGHPSAHRALVVATATAAALGAAQAAPAVAAQQAPDRPGVPAGDEPTTPQGRKAPLHGPAGQPARPGVPTGPVATPPTTRADIIRRAKLWVSAQVPYSMSAFWHDGYRQDCSGFVSMAWHLPGNEWTGSLDRFGTRIAKEELQPGDILLFHNKADPEKGSHVVVFGGWTDYTHSYYFVYEQTRPITRRQATPYAYWSHSDRYVPYRYKGLTSPAPGDAGVIVAGAAGANRPVGGSVSATSFPGRAVFGPGANNSYVTLLGRLLVERGAGRFYRSGPGPRWSAADGGATRAFQRAQGWSGADADGRPGPRTWSLLITGTGRNIGAPPATDAGSGAAGAPAVPPAPRVPPYPGRAVFRPGARSAHVTQLGRQLVKKGFARFYATGPGPRWGEADRRGVEAFQRAQGWRGGAADGYPGPETWRRLFS
ncbi:membrane protein [Streptomyces humidus]|uniref:Membrane protein n=1 Tax=Streptomyces humidus TaxID=52259 RepID=A0A918FQ43_9ACTN|nr:peptidoglycan-binding protein [Streptomyces humidus]GGR67177.1 membrane protein [Streptomyces humidus]